LITNKSLILREYYKNIKQLNVKCISAINRFGQRITTRGIASQLKHFAEKYGMNKEVVYPHSFRHRFAKNFLDRFNDLALLADLMGHESIETTRIYLRRTASEQQKIVDKVVNW
jgi:site-specific recombinase XerD